MGDLAAAFEASVAANPDLTPADAGLIALGRLLARQIDEVMDSGSAAERTRSLYLGPHLLSVLRAMFATPEARHAAKKVRVEPTGKLAQMRALRDVSRPTTKQAPSRRRARNAEEGA